jgi:hypothetical protein
MRISYTFTSFDLSSLWAKTARARCHATSGGAAGNTPGGDPSKSAIRKIARRSNNPEHDPIQSDRLTL